MDRYLKEFRIRGIKTNIPVIENVIQHDQSKSGEYNTTFIDETPELFVFPKRKDRGTKMLTYIGHTTINGFEGMEKKKKPIFTKPAEPKIYKLEDLPAGTRSEERRVGKERRDGK